MPESNPLILVIDDEEVVQASVERILSRLGYRVEGAMTAKEGLEKLGRTAFDAVITDLMMPEMNGLELLEEMRVRGLDVPAIMITGFPTIKTAVKALRLGATDYIPKPFTRQELLSPLNRALRRERSGPEVEAGFLNRTSPDLLPGDKFVLPKHSWAVYNQDGSMEVGVEESFLATLPSVEEVELPFEADLVEQGHPGLKLKTKDEVHAVFMPLSGRVLGVNKDVLADPKSVTAQVWLIRILPNRLTEELEGLRRQAVG